VTLQRPFQGWLATRGLALVTVNLSAEIKLSITTHYKDMKSDTKYRN